VLEYSYPRLDVEVSKKLIHLLKSPFVVHPGTGRVCVPIDPRQLGEFDPLSVPTVTELLGEIDQWDAVRVKEPAGDMEGSVENAPKRIHDYEKTRLKPFVEYFKSFVAALMKDEKGESGGAGGGGDSRRVVKREGEHAAGSDAMEF
jgi:DNA primase small subunit